MLFRFTGATLQRRIARIDDTRAAYGYDSRWHIEGNVVEGFSAVSSNNWAGGVDFEGATSEPVNRHREAFVVAPVTTQTASAAYRLVLADAGATRPRRDPVDARIVREVQEGTATFGDGIIDSPAQVGGWPELKSTSAPPDQDGDGIPDDWETHHGLDPKNPADRNGHTLSTGFTNLEVYLDDITRKRSEEHTSELQSH